MKIYLVNPKNDWAMYYGDEFLQGKRTYMIDTTLPTVAGCIPKDIDIEMCDSRVHDINYNTDAEWVGLTVKLGQHRSMKEIASKFKALGKKIMLGGPFVSGYTSEVREYADIVVKGEIEEIAPKIFSDIKSGTYQNEYQGTRPSLTLSPTPRWDLYPSTNTYIGNLQTTRGCPFGCDFCDSVQLTGTLARCKSETQVINELNVLYHDFNFNVIFISDDNPIANMVQAKKTFQAITDWGVGKNVTFISQMPTNLTYNDEMLALVAKSGLRQVYVGIESFDSELLKGVHKSHNTVHSHRFVLDKLVTNGIVPVIGCILGFDKHTTDIFETTYNECMKLPVPLVTLNTLWAFPGTPMTKRYEEEGRIDRKITDLSGYPWHTNIVPKNMTVNELGRNVHKLLNRLNEPEAFKTRVINTLSKLKKAPYYNNLSQEKNRDFAYTIIKHITRMSDADRKMCQYFLKNHKDSLGYVLEFFAFYAQSRHLCDIEYKEI